MINGTLTTVDGAAGDLVGEVEAVVTTVAVSKGRRKCACDLD